VDSGPFGRGVSSERDLHILQKNVHSLSQTRRRVSHTINAGLSRENHQVIGYEVLSDDVVFNDECCHVAVFNDSSDSLRHVQSLFNVQIGTRLVQQVKISPTRETSRDGHFLQLSATEFHEVSVTQGAHF